MAIYQGFMTMREEKVFYHIGPVQVVSEFQPIIQNSCPVLYDREEVSYFPVPAMRDEYHGAPTKTVTVRPLPPQQVQYYPYPNMDQNDVPPPHHQIRRPVKTVEVPAQKPHQIKGPVLNNIEAAKKYRGVSITTVYGPRPNYP